MNKFRNGAGARYLRALFFETTPADKSTVLYTLKDSDHEGYPSLYLLYMASEDLLEYDFANTYLDGWEHWQMLCECPWFEPYVTRWRQELELVVRSKALARLRQDADSDSRSSAASNRFLLERGWIDKPQKGRPTKASVKAETQRQAAIKKSVQDDYDRMTAHTSQELQ